MIISRAALFVLILVIALGVACSDVGDQASNGGGDTAASNSGVLKTSIENLTKNFKDAANSIDSAMVALELPNKDGDGKLQKTKEPVNAAIEALKSDDMTKIANLVVSLPPSEDTKAKLEQLQKDEGSARTSLEKVQTTLAKKEHDVFAPAEHDQVVVDLQNAKSGNSAGLKHLEPLQKSIAAAIDVKADAERKKKGSTDDNGTRDLVVLVAEILGAVVLSVLAVFGIVSLSRRHWAKFDTHLVQALTAHFGNFKNQQSDLAGKLSALASTQGELSTRLGDIQTEVRSLGRLVRDAALDGGIRGSATPASSQTDQTPPKDDPAFPISAGDYLERMRRFSIVVKPDFQNGILVDDPEGRGELALIRDARVPDDIQPLFVIPRSTQFQTKQDFHTYFEKYYDCQKPSAGEVWIIDPAVVSTVPGGWQLREKGVLEVR
jgi:hypothetical protein